MGDIKSGGGFRAAVALNRDFVGLADVVSESFSKGADLGPLQQALQSGLGQIKAGQDAATTSLDQANEKLGGLLKDSSFNQLAEALKDGLPNAELAKITGKLGEVVQKLGDIHAVQKDLAKRLESGLTVRLSLDDLEPSSVKGAIEEALRNLNKLLAERTGSGNQAPCN
jgi:hypothetical protein